MTASETFWSPVLWADDHIRLLDQTLLPEKEVWLEIADVDALCEAIRNLRVRGAPAIGIAAAMGAALTAFNSEGPDWEAVSRSVKKACLKLAATRPTAVNLFKALDRMERRLEFSAGQTVTDLREGLLAEALAVAEEDRRIGESIGLHGAGLLTDPAVVLTHCNAGGLATSGFGTALGVVYAAHRMGKKIHVFADETRPLWQGARLTAWELSRAGVDVTVITDSAAAWLMKTRRIDCVLVGADRIARNGDTANKIGTYGLAVLARSHGVPFYVAAPATTFDPEADSAADIPIEERSGDEMRTAFGRRIVPDAAAVWNPAFDVTPGELVAGFITERGVIHPPFENERFINDRQ